MDKLCFAFAIAEAELESVGLEGLKIGNRAYFEPFLLSGRVYLEVISNSRGKAQITPTEA